MSLSINSSDRPGADKVSSFSVDHVPRAIFRLPGAKRRILILGLGSLAKSLSQVLSARSKVFTDVVGVLAKESVQVGDEFVGMKILGTMDHLIEVVERYRVDTIAVCLEDRRAILPVQTLLEVKSRGVEVLDGHQLYEEEAGRLSIDLLKPSVLIFSTGFSRRALAMTLKRTTDLLLASSGIVILAPIVLLLALLIKMDSPGPVFYRQIRVGLRGQPYLIWKFRSMMHDAETSGARWASKGDPRISRVGRLMRARRLDELPQLLNVIKGEMSLVGPRPERPAFVQNLRDEIPYYDLRHTVRPGITGWAQTQFRYGASAEDSHTKLQYDLYYVKNLSLALDLRIMFETISVVLSSHGAR